VNAKHTKDLSHNRPSQAGRPSRTELPTGFGTGPKRRTPQQFLGEIATQIVGLQYHDAPVEPGQQVELLREPDNPHDPRAIQVENDRLRTIGYLPRQVSHWLAPLMDAGKLRVEAYVPAGPGCAEADTSQMPLVLMAFLTTKGQAILQSPSAATAGHLLHALVLRAYLDARAQSDPVLIGGLCAGLEPLLQQELLPESKLLLSLIPGMAKELRAARGLAALATLRTTLGQVRIGEPLLDHGLTIFPLSWPAPQEPPYVLLSRAIAIGTAVVEEVSQNGSVPHLCVHNKGLRALLIPEGEILVGAKQNRVVNVTVLVAAKSAFTLPVSCVERGRWQYRSKVFSNQCCAPPSLRSKKLRSVMANRREQGEARSDQGEVWDEVDHCLADLHIASPTASLTDALTRAAERLEQSCRELPLPQDAAGVVVGRDGRLVGMDLFDAPATLQEVWPRLRAAYGLDGLRQKAGGPALPPEQARRMLDLVGNRARAGKTPLGLGEHVEVCGGGLIGAGLVYDSRLCHLAAFAESA